MDGKTINHLHLLKSFNFQNSEGWYDIDPPTIETNVIIITYMNMSFFLFVAITYLK